MTAGVRSYSHSGVPRYTDAAYISSMFPPGVSIFPPREISSHAQRAVVSTLRRSMYRPSGAIALTCQAALIGLRPATHTAHRVDGSNVRSNAIASCSSASPGTSSIENRSSSGLKEISNPVSLITSTRSESTSPVIGLSLLIRSVCVLIVVVLMVVLIVGRIAQLHGLDFHGDGNGHQVPRVAFHDGCRSVNRTQQVVPAAVAGELRDQVQAHAVREDHRLPVDRDAQLDTKVPHQNPWSPVWSCGRMHWRLPGGDRMSWSHTYAQRGVPSGRQASARYWPVGSSYGRTAMSALCRAHWRTAAAISSSWPASCSAFSSVTSRCTVSPPTGSKETRTTRAGATCQVNPAFTSCPRRTACAPWPAGRHSGPRPRRPGNRRAGRARPRPRFPAGAARPWRRVAASDCASRRSGRPARPGSRWRFSSCVPSCLESFQTFPNGASFIGGWNRTIRASRTSWPPSPFSPRWPRASPPRPASPPPCVPEPPPPRQRPEPRSASPPRCPPTAPHEPPATPPARPRPARCPGLSPPPFRRAAPPPPRTALRPPRTPRWLPPPRPPRSRAPPRSAPRPRPSPGPGRRPFPERSPSLLSPLLPHHLQLSQSPENVSIISLLSETLELRFLL